MKNGKKFSKFEIDQFKEVLNIGASHASTALSRLIGKRVFISVPKIHGVDRQGSDSGKIGSFNEDDKVLAVISKFESDKPSIVCFYSDKEVAQRMVACEIAARGDKDENRQGSERALLIALVGKIGSSALKNVSYFLGNIVTTSFSDIRYDALGAIDESIMADAGKESELVLMASISFKIEGESVDPQLCLYLNESTLRRMLGILESKPGGSPG